MTHTVLRKANSSRELVSSTQITAASVRRIKTMRSWKSQNLQYKACSQLRTRIACTPRRGKHQVSCSLSDFHSSNRLDPNSLTSTPMRRSWIDIGNRIPPRAPRPTIFTETSLNLTSASNKPQSSLLPPPSFLHPASPQKLRKTVPSKMTSPL